MPRPLAVSGALLLACASSLLAPAKAAPPSRPHLTERWIYVMTNLQPAETVPQLQAIMKKAHDAGYNGMVLADGKLSFLDRVLPQYFTNAQAIVKTAQDLGMDIYPCVTPMGYSNSLLSNDPNLAEGLPVKNALFTVHNGTADVTPEPAVGLVNGDFEAANGDRLTGWSYQDNPGQATFVDTVVKHGGKQSLRMENLGTGNPPSGNGRIVQQITVSPFRQYHLSVWLKTDGFDTPGDVRALILPPNGRALNYNDWSIQRTQDWTEYHTVFNSLDNTKLSVYIGAWGGRTGKLWLDDAKLEEVGLLNVIRRAGTPLVVKGEDGTVYKEGTDYAPVSDPRFGNVPWPGEYEVYHTPPVIQIPAGSRIADGQRLRVSFYHTVLTTANAVAACLSEPKVFDLMRDQIRRVDALFHPKGFFFSHDEIRVANWCETCQKQKKTPGQLLAANVRECISMVHKIHPGARIIVWSDMFDPTHNATDNYYLVNGTWAGSWEGLTKDVEIANWNSGNPKGSLPFFANRGHKQVLAGYYDGPPENIVPWLDAANGLPGIEGVMYTTWANDYSNLEPFARAAWGPQKLSK